MGVSRSGERLRREWSRRRALVSGSPLRLSLALAVGLLAAAVAPAGAWAQAIDGQYIVVLKSRSSGAAVEHAKGRVRAHGRVQRQFSTALKGFSAKLDAKGLAAL